MDYLWDFVCVLVAVAAYILIFKMNSPSSKAEDEINKNRQDRFLQGNVK
jgi:hypothetical protein